MASSPAASAGTPQGMSGNIDARLAPSRSTSKARSMSAITPSARAWSSARCSAESDAISRDSAAIRRAMFSSSSSRVFGLSGNRSPNRCMNPSKSYGSPRSRCSIIWFSSASMSLNRWTCSGERLRIPSAMLRKYAPSTCSLRCSINSSNSRCASWSTNRKSDSPRIGPEGVLAPVPLRVARAHPLRVRRSSENVARGLRVAEPGGERPKRQAEAEERGPGERDPRLGSERLLPCERVGDGKENERAEPVDVVEPGRRSIPQHEQHDADERLHDGHHLDRRQPPPEPVARLSLGAPDHEAPQPPHGEQGDDDPADVLVDPWHGRQILRCRGSFVPVGPQPAGLLLVQATGEVQPFQGELDR